MHLRTRKEMSLVPAHWELAHKIVELRDTYSPSTLVLGNGDVKTLAEAQQKAQETGLDGIMLGRAIFGNPWVFTGKTESDTTSKERVEALLTLAQYFDELRPRKSLHILKKHFKAFIQGWPHASELRARLMDVTTEEELEVCLREALTLLG